MEMSDSQRKRADEGNYRTEYEEARARHELKLDRTYFDSEFDNEQAVATMLQSLRGTFGTLLFHLISPVG
jgi:hypothetical protein